MLKPILMHQVVWFHDFYYIRYEIIIELLFLYPHKPSWLVYLLLLHCVSPLGIWNNFSQLLSEKLEGESSIIAYIDKATHNALSTTIVTLNALLEAWRWKNKIVVLALLKQGQDGKKKFQVKGMVVLFLQQVLHAWIMSAKNVFLQNW